MFRRFIILLLVASAAVALLPSTFAQDQQRPRTVMPADPATIQQPQSLNSPVASPRILPARPGSTVPRTLADLRSQIVQNVHDPALAAGFFAVKVASLDTRQLIDSQ